MLATFSNTNYHESTASGKYYPGDDAKSETENCPDDRFIVSLIASEPLQNLCLSRGRFGGNLSCYLKRVLPESFGIGYNRGITSARVIFVLKVRRMSQCIIICPSCEREIMSDDQVRRTPRGRVICEQCAEDTYLDVPLA